MAEDPEWYVSSLHCRRAIGYLAAKLYEDGLLVSEINPSRFMMMWEESLQQTIADDEPSPLGPDSEQARKFLLAKIEARITRMEDRGDQMESAISFISTWMLRNLTHFGHREHQEIEAILYDTKSATNPTDRDLESS